MACGSSLWQFAACLLLLHSAAAQISVISAPIPDPFRVGDKYPSGNQTDACDPIQAPIVRFDQRFFQLHTSDNPKINFTTTDSRIMSSRLNFLLNSLADVFGSTMTVLKAWTPYPDPSLGGNTGSLHYEGRSVQITVPSKKDLSELLKQAVSVGFDCVFYESSNCVTLSVSSAQCSRNFDGVFILDGSISVTTPNFEIIKAALKKMVSLFPIGPDLTRIGIVQFAGNVRREFPLDKHDDLPSLLKGIEDVKYWNAGWTRTWKGINEAKKMLTTDQFGARSGFPKIVILITDGESHFRADTLKATAEIKAAGVDVFVIGVGNALSTKKFMEELELVASKPLDDFLVTITNFEDAATNARSLGLEVCDAVKDADCCHKIVNDSSLIRPDNGFLGSIAIIGAYCDCNPTDSQFKWGVKWGDGGGFEWYDGQNPNFQQTHQYPKSEKSYLVEVKYCNINNQGNIGCCVEFSKTIRVRGNLNC